MMHDEVTHHMAVAPHEKEKLRDLRTRIMSLESSMYRYDSSKGKGTWRKDNPKAATLLDDLLKQDVRHTVEETKPASGPEKGEKGAAGQGPETDSTGVGDNASKTPSTNESYTANAPKPVKYGF